MADSGLHPTLKELLAQPGNPNAVPVEKQTPEDARAEFDADIAAVDAPAPVMASVCDMTLPGAGGAIPVRLYTPKGLTTPAPVMVYFHGGGNIRGNIVTHDSTCRVLADSGCCIVVSVDYRLAPEHPFPAAADDAAAAVNWVAANAATLGGDPARLIVGGDSAGGNLAAIAALRARDEGGPKLAAQLLIYPVIDHVTETESKRLYAKGYMLDSMPFYTRSYLPDEGSRSHPHASPIFAADHTRLPPAVILTAGFDPLHDEAKSYADALAAAGVTVEYDTYPSMIHGFTLLRKFLPEADEALAKCARAAVRLASGRE